MPNIPPTHGSLSRRKLFAAAGTTAAAGVLGAFAAGPAYATPRAAGPRIMLPANAQKAALYKVGPVRLSDPRTLANFPQDARIVKWPWARSQNKTINDAVQLLGANDILALPEDEKPYEIDSSRGFNGKNAWKAMVRVRRGVVGYGPNSVIRPSASSFRGPQQTGTAGLQEKVMESATPGAYFGNFTMYGRDFGPMGYHGIGIGPDDPNAKSGTFEKIRFAGAHRGFGGMPPGEAGAVSAYRGWGTTFVDVWVDGLDPFTGQFVGSSPLMLNRVKDTVINNLYLHNTRVGMPTFWECNGAKIFGLRHVDVARGRISSSPGLNIEDCTGHFDIRYSEFRLQYRGAYGNTGLHFNVGGARGFVGSLFARGLEFDDSAAGAKVITIQHWGAQRRANVNYTFERADRTAQPFQIYGS